MFFHKENNQEEKNLIIRKIEDLSISMEKMKLAEYVNLLNNPKRLLFINFIAGLARGIGTAVGFTLLGALVVYLLQRLVLLNIPGIGDFVAEVVRMVNYRLGY